MSKNNSHTPSAPATSHRTIEVVTDPARMERALDRLFRRVEFHDRVVTVVGFRGRATFRAAEVGEAIGYSEGRILVDKIRGDWRDEFREGKDYDVLRGAGLREFKRLSSLALESGPDRSPELLVLYPSGVDRALILARTPLGRELRDLLVDHVLPQLRESGTATLPGAPTPAPALTAETAAQFLEPLVSDIVARILAAHARSGPGDILDGAAESLVLAKVRRLAAVAAGPSAAPREVHRQRSALHVRLRRAVGWTGPWRMFPRARRGDLMVALRAEELTIERIADAVARVRQLSLRAVNG